MRYAGDVPPPGAYVRDMVLLVDVPAGTTPQTWTVVTPDASQASTFEVPPQENAIVRYFGLDTNAPAGEAFVRFRFMVNDGTQINYQSPPVNIGDIDEPTLVHQALKPGDKFNVELTNLDTTIPYTVSVRVFLWCIPSKLLAAGRGVRF